jgi:3-phosphoshikimate 1-carboxyvinyltransferase
MSHSQELTYVVQPGGKLQGRLRVPGDKSVSHRSIMFGALAEGTTRVSGFLQGEDSLNTLRAFRAMGVQITDPTAQGEVTIQGVGMHGLKAPSKPLYMGNSGTSMRLLTGLLAGQSFDTVLEGDASLTKRPMKRVTEPLTKMGARIDSIDGYPPLRIKGGNPLRGIEYAMPMASAQVKSCLLLAGMYAQGQTTVIEPAPSRDHTERMLTAFGYPVQREGGRIQINGGGRLQASAIPVPADISSAAFFMVGASIATEGEVVLEQVGINPTRIGVIEILRLMGANIELGAQRMAGGEPVADIRIRPAQLRGIEIPEELVPLAIDEFPVLFVAAACAKGTTVLRGAEELRVKESDRIQVMADGLQTLGIKAQPTPDGIVIEGGKLGGGEIQSHGDHRIAMAFSMASLRASQTIVIHECLNVNTSFPGFVQLAGSAGVAITVKPGT